MMNRHLLRVLLALIAAVGIRALPAGAQTRFEVAIDPALHTRPLTGRLLLILGRSAEPEPRLVMAPHGPPFFGLDLERLQPNTSAIIDQGTLGYPAGLADLAPGEYWAQAVVGVYSEAKRADGHTIWVALNDGMQEFLTTAAGNLYSEPQRVQVGDSGTFRLHITKQVPPRTRPQDNPWVRHVQIRSEKLSRFWGRPIFVNATVLLPKGYDEHPETRFPTIYTFGHSVPAESFGGSGFCTAKSGLVGAPRAQHPVHRPGLRWSRTAVRFRGRGRSAGAPIPGGERTCNITCRAGPICPAFGGRDRRPDGRAG